jgi:hypothetical protein
MDSSGDLDDDNRPLMPRRGRSGEVSSPRTLTPERQIDAWGDPYISPTKEKRDIAKATELPKELAKGPLFSSLNTILHHVFRVQPKSLALLVLAINSFLGVSRVLFNLFVAFLNPWENFLDRGWPSINIFTGAIYVPKFNMASAFPYWFRPLQIKRMEWDAIRLLISVSAGVHIAVDVEKFQAGFIFEEVVRDRTKHRRKDDTRSPDLGYDKTRKREGRANSVGHGREALRTPPSSGKGSERQKEAAKKKVAHFSTFFRSTMERLRYYGINIAVNIDEVGVGMEFKKLELDGTVTTSDDWWCQGTHVRALDVGMTLSTHRSASFLSWEVMELRFLEEETSDSEDEGDNDSIADTEYSDALFDVGGVEAAGAGRDDTSWHVRNAASADELLTVQQTIARQLFEDGNSSDSDGPHRQLYAPPLGGKKKKAKDHFARALEDPPLLSLSAFSCGANVFLELAQMDFSSRSAMMSKYGEIKRIYRQSNQYSASGPVGTSPSAHFARRRHAHMRGELPGDRQDEDASDTNGRELTRREQHKLDSVTRMWGLSMSAVAISVFYAYAKAQGGSK